MLRRSSDGPAKLPLPRVAVLGGGPVGLEAALYARSLGLPVTLFEAGQVGEFVSRWGFVRLFTPFGWNATPLGKQAVLKDKPTHSFPTDTDVLTGREYRDAYLVPVSESSTLAGVIKTKTAVLSVGRSGWRKTDSATKDLPPFRILVRDASGQERFESADAVLDCTGTYAKPNWAGDGGIPAAGEIAARQHAAYWLDDIPGAKKNHYAGKCIAVVGGGFSAATAVCDLAALAEDHQATWIVWLTHGPRSQPLPRVANDPLKDRDRLAAKANSLALRCDGNLEYHAQVQIDELMSHGPDKGFRVVARITGKPTSWEVERLIAHVGYRPDVSLTQELRVGEPGGSIVTPEPNYFVLGAKALGRDSGFLIRDAQTHVREAFATLLGKPGLNLYAKAA
jgi:thioredoxin reductase